MPSIMNDAEVDIRVLALRRQQNRRNTTSRELTPTTPIKDTYPRIPSGQSAYETTPIKTYSVPSDISRTVNSTPVRRNSYFSTLPASLFDEDSRIGRMHVPPVVRCQCNGVDSYALISTSDAVSSINMEFVKKLRLLDQVIPELNQMFNPIAVQQPQIKGKVKYIDLSIGSWQQVAQFSVLDNFNADIILGTDFLRRTQSMINFEDSVLVIGGHQGERIPFLTSKEVMGLSKRNTKPSFANGFAKIE